MVSIGFGRLEMTDEIVTVESLGRDGDSHRDQDSPQG